MLPGLQQTVGLASTIDISTGMMSWLGCICHKMVCLGEAPSVTPSPVLFFGTQVRALLIRSRQQVLGHLEVLLPALFDALSGPSDRVVLEALSVQVCLPAQQRL